MIGREEAEKLEKLEKRKATNLAQLIARRIMGLGGNLGKT